MLDDDQITYNKIPLSFNNKCVEFSRYENSGAIRLWRIAKQPPFLDSINLIENSSRLLSGRKTIPGFLRSWD